MMVVSEEALTCWMDARKSTLEKSKLGRIIRSVMVVSEACFRHLMPIIQELEILNLREAVNDLPLHPDLHRQISVLLTGN